jgi:hypothetical protein
MLGCVEQFLSGVRQAVTRRVFKKKIPMLLYLIPELFIPELFIPELFI